MNARTEFKLAKPLGAINPHNMVIKLPLNKDEVQRVYGALDCLYEGKKAVQVGEIKKGIRNVLLGTGLSQDRVNSVLDCLPAMPDKVGVSRNFDFEPEWQGDSIGKGPRQIQILSHFSGTKKIIRDLNSLLKRWFEEELDVRKKIPFFLGQIQRSYQDQDKSFGFLDITLSQIEAECMAALDQDGVIREPIIFSLAPVPEIETTENVFVPSDGNENVTVEFIKHSKDSERNKRSKGKDSLNDLPLCFYEKYPAFSLAFARLLQDLDYENLTKVLLEEFPVLTPDSTEDFFNQPNLFKGTGGIFFPATFDKAGVRNFLKVFLQQEVMSINKDFYEAWRNFVNPLKGSSGEQFSASIDPVLDNIIRYIDLRFRSNAKVDPEGLKRYATQGHVFEYDSLSARLLKITDELSTPLLVRQAMAPIEPPKPKGNLIFSHSRINKPPAKPAEQLVLTDKDRIAAPSAEKGSLWGLAKAWYRTQKEAMKAKKEERFQAKVSKARERINDILSTGDGSKKAFRTIMKALNGRGFAEDPGMQDFVTETLIPACGGIKKLEQIKQKMPGQWQGFLVQ